MERYYLKCTYCERPISVECEREDIKLISTLTCPLCGKHDLPLTIMGRIEGTDAHLITDGVKAACDARCTNAIGPHCDCICNNKNHGTHRLVTYSKDNGTLSVVDQHLLDGNEEYLAKIKELAEQKQNFRQLILASLNLKYGDVVKLFKNRWETNVSLTHEQWMEHSRYTGYKEMMDKIEKLRTIKNKVNAYLKLWEQLRLS